MDPVKTSEEISTSRIHYELVRALVDTGRCPKKCELAQGLDVSVAEIEQVLFDLSELHGLVLHPHVSEPWLVHPFSITPTAHWVEGSDKSWWAPCIWCAFGVTRLVGGETRIHTRIGGEAEPLVILVVNGQPAGLEDVWVHFAIPPARAWDNVHQHCSMVLPFRSPEDIVAWCDRHGVTHGEDVSLHQVAQLAQVWYGMHANRNWHKWTIAEAQDIFRKVGLVSPFWDLGAREGGY